MNLYKLSQDINNDYDTYDACIVAAEYEEEARKIHPHELGFDEDNNYQGPWVSFNEIYQIKVELIGIADESIKQGVILSSFNAG